MKALLNDLRYALRDIAAGGCFGLPGAGVARLAARSYASAAHGMKSP